MGRPWRWLAQVAPDLLRPRAAISPLPRDPVAGDNGSAGWRQSGRSWRQRAYPRSCARTQEASRLLSPPLHAHLGPSRSTLPFGLPGEAVTDAWPAPRRGQARPAPDRV